MDQFWQGGTPARRRYVLRTWAFMVPYIGICVAMMAGAFDDLYGRPVGWVLAAALSAPVIGQLWATLSLMRESDEFVRALVARQFIVATGLTLATAVFWGFGENLRLAPHIESWLIYPLFWFCFGVTSPFIRSTRA